MGQTPIASCDSGSVPKMLPPCVSMQAIRRYFAQPSGYNPVAIAITIVLAGGGPEDLVTDGAAVLYLGGVGVMVMYDYMKNHPSTNTVLPKNSAECPGTGKGWVWRGNLPVGGNKGAWHNPETGASAYPNFDHPPPIPGHWDYNPERGAPKQRIPPGGDTEKHGPAF